MGSLEEETLVQMVHDFMESESSAPCFPPTSNCSSIFHQAEYFTLQGILRSVISAETKVLEALPKQMRNRNDGDEFDGVKRNTSNYSLNNKWLVTRLKMDGFHASVCQTSCVTSLGCPAGDYEYIEIMLRDEKGETHRVIVDIDFRSQFELARPTSSYKQLTDSLPVCFVGSEEKLNKIISLLCSAAKRSLRERGLHVPPWRTTTYMQSKWLSGSRKLARQEPKTGANLHGLAMWAPPSALVTPKRSNLGKGGSGLSSQFSSMSVNCC